MEESATTQTCREQALSAERRLRYEDSKTTNQQSGSIVSGSRNNSLPADVLAIVFGFLAEDEEFCACDLVCKSWHSANSDAALWRDRVERLFRGKHLNYILRPMPRDRKSTYAYAKTDAKRQIPLSVQEITECEWSLRFLESMGNFWVGFNPPKGSGRILKRRFCPGGAYWYPEDDPVFRDARIMATLPPEMHWVMFRQQDAVFMQLEDFPAMNICREHRSWGWVIRGFRTEYTSIGTVSDE